MFSKWTKVSFLMMLMRFLCEVSLSTLAFRWCCRSGETCRWLLWAQQISDEVSPTVFIYFLLQYLVCSPSAITAAHLSGIESTYFLRTSTLTSSCAFCNSRQRLSFDCTTDLSTLLCNNRVGVPFLVLMKCITNTKTQVRLTFSIIHFIPLKILFFLIVHWNVKIPLQ